MVDAWQVAPEQYAAGPGDPVAFISDAARAADGVDPLDEATYLRLRHHGLTDSALWLTDGGFALVRRGHAHDDGSHVPASLDLVVTPAARRTGHGRALAIAALRGLDDEVFAWSHGDHPGATVLAGHHGFERVRELLVLERPASGQPVRTRGTTGAQSAEIRAFRPGDEAELLRVNAAAFADHPEQGAMGPENLAERMAESWFDPAGLIVADTGDRLAGFHWTKVHPDGEGEVYVLAVDPAAQGTGLGGALTRAGLAHLEDAGCSVLHLYVEATNGPALALYRGLGFTDRRRHVQYRRPAAR
jgi:mycothiol synthase